jgi:hypothetical protein
VTTDWIIRGDALQTPARQAGGWALKGFELQQKYAALWVVELLGSVGGLIAVRYEGAQDIDLLYADRRVLHVQVKNRPSEVLNWSNLEPVLHGFLNDWLDATPEDRDRLTFRLVTVSMPEGDDVTQVLRRVYLKRAAAKLATSAAAGIRKTHGAVLKDHAYAMLLKTTIELAPDTVADHLDLVIRGRLAPFVHHPAEAADAVADILTTLKAGAVMTGREALDLIRRHTLSDHHPFAANSPFRAVGPGLTPPSSSAVDSFRKGSEVTWEGLDKAIDVERDISSDLIKALREATHAEFHVLIGPGGAGKTTVARRVAYDLGKSGSHLAFDLSDQNPEPEDWEALFAFARVMGRCVLLLLDDPKERTAALDYMLGLDTDRSILILATRRPGAEVAAMLEEASMPICSLEMGPVTHDDVDRLSKALGKPAPTGVELSELTASGQFFLLAMVMSEGSVERFAIKLLEPLRSESADVFDAYVDLCLCARQDQRIPEVVLLKRYPLAVRLDQNARLSGLVRRLGARMDALRAGHALLSSAVVAVERINPAIRALALLDFVDAADDVERRFGVRLVQSITALDPGPAKASAQAFETHLLRFSQHGHYSDLSRIKTALDDLGRSDTADRIAGTAAAAPIRTGVDASIKMSNAPTGSFAAVFPELLDFYTADPTPFGRRNFIARCSVDATAAQATSMVRAMFPWILRNGCPAAETKSLLDVLSIRTDIDTLQFKDEIGQLLDGMPSEIRLLYPATVILDSRISDKELDTKLSAVAARTITLDSAIAFPPACMGYARSIQLRGDDPTRNALAGLLLNAARDARLDTDGQKRKTLLCAALTCVTDAQLERLRQDALSVSFPPKMAAEARNMMTHIRRV